MNDLSNTSILLWLIGAAAVLGIVVVVLRSFHSIGAAQVGLVIKNFSTKKLHVAGSRKR